VDQYGSLPPNGFGYNCKLYYKGRISRFQACRSNSSVFNIRYCFVIMYSCLCDSSTFWMTFHLWNVGLFSL